MKIVDSRSHYTATSTTPLKRLGPNMKSRDEFQRYQETRKRTPLGDITSNSVNAGAGVKKPAAAKRALVGKSGELGRRDHQGQVSKKTSSRGGASGLVTNSTGNYRCLEPTSVSKPQNIERSAAHALQSVERHALQSAVVSNGAQRCPQAGHDERTRTSSESGHIGSSYRRPAASGGSRIPITQVGSLIQRKPFGRSTADHGPLQRNSNYATRLKSLLDPSTWRQTQVLAGPASRQKLLQSLVSYNPAVAQSNRHIRALCDSLRLQKAPVVFPRSVSTVPLTADPRIGDGHVTVLQSTPMGIFLTGITTSSGERIIVVNMDGDYIAEGGILELGCYTEIDLAGVPAKVYRQWKITH